MEIICTDKYYDSKFESEKDYSSVCLVSGGYVPIYLINLVSFSAIDGVLGQESDSLSFSVGFDNCRSASNALRVLWECGGGGSGIGSNDPSSSYFVVPLTSNSMGIFHLLCCYIFRVKVMTKNKAIHWINKSASSIQLSTKNTHWSNIVEYCSDEGWWLNIPFCKFSQDLNIILNNEKEKTFLHIFIPAKSISEPESTFRNKGNAADIFMPIARKYRLVDMQARSTRHNFCAYSANEYSYKS